MEQEYEEKKKKEEERKGKEMERFMSIMMCGEVGGDDGLQSKGGDNEQNYGAVNTEDGIPFACHLCRGPFQNPIVTTCNHYFCEKCMMRRIKDEGTTGCPICQKDTHGVLNHASKLVAKKRRLVGRDGTWEEYLERSKGGGDGEE
jgi:RING finger protein 113A